MYSMYSTYVCSRVFLHSAWMLIRDPPKRRQWRERTLQMEQGASREFHLCTLGNGWIPATENQYTLYYCMYSPRTQWLCQTILRGVGNAAGQPRNVKLPNEGNWIRSPLDGVHFVAVESTQFSGKNAKHTNELKTEFFGVTIEVDDFTIFGCSDWFRCPMADRSCPRGGCFDSSWKAWHGWGNLRRSWKLWKLRRRAGATRGVVCWYSIFNLFVSYILLYIQYYGIIHTLRICFHLNEYISWDISGINPFSNTHFHKPLSISPSYTRNSSSSTPSRLSRWISGTSSAIIGGTWTPRPTSMPCWPRVLFRLVSFLWHCFVPRQLLPVWSLHVLCAQYLHKHSLNQNLGSLAYYAICISITHVSTS